MNNSKLNQRFDIVLIDADETLFDFKEAETQALKLMLDDIGITANDEMIAVYSDINLKLWKALERGEVSREELQVLRFEQFFNKICVTDVDFSDANKSYLSCLAQCPFMIDKASDFVKKLHDYCDIYIATNGLVIPQTGRVYGSEIADYIDGVFISEQMGCCKPDKAYFEYIFKQLRIEDKSKVVIIGDSLTSDMQGGKNAGITTCLFSRSKSKVDSDLCDYQIADYEEFFDILFER